MRFRRLAIVVGAVGAFATVTFPVMRASASSAPFNDPSAQGFIGLCDRSEHPITSGSLDDVPFIWTAVSSVPAPQGYEHGKATLYAYQPIKNIPPSQWGGRMLTASSSFTNPAHPMAQATNGDSPLLWFVQAYPPKWDGLIQLRMFYSGVNLSTDLSPYPATILKVSGNSWSVVSGGTVSCNIGKATSAESVDLPASALASPQTLNVHDGSTSGGGSSPSSTADSSRTPEALRENGVVPGRSAEMAPALSSGGGGLSGGVILGTVLGVLAVLGGGGTWLWRRRFRANI
jgi:hypothetical protein